MKNIRLYELDSNYQIEKDTHEYPTVSYAKDTDKVYYMEQGNYVRTKMNVESTNGLTPYIGSSFDLTQMEYIKVTYEDGTIEKVDMSVEPTSYYTFTQAGDVVVDIYLKTDWDNASHMFACSTEIIPIYEIDFTHCKTNKVTNMSYMFVNTYSISSANNGHGILKNIIFGGNFNTSNVTNMSYMFYGCGDLTSLDLSSFDTSNVTDMNGMFYFCTNLTSLDLSSFNTSNLTSMEHMFRECHGLTSLDLSSFDTSNVMVMSNMFTFCHSLTSITFGSQADVSKVRMVQNMFYGITTTGTLYYPSAYADAWNNILVGNQSLSRFPSTWTATAVD